MRRVKNSNASRSKSRTRKRRIRILLVDDHPSVLAGIQSHLRSKRDFNVVGLALNGEEAVKKAKSLNPDIMIVDLSLPRLNGLEVMRKVHADNQETKFVIYTMHDGKEFVREALSAGADGYVLKSSPLRILVGGIERVRCGETFIEPHLLGTRPPVSSSEISAAGRSRFRGKFLIERQSHD